MGFIQDLIARNPAAAYEKKGRWRIIVIEYLKANPGQTFKQIKPGLGINVPGTAWSSCQAAVRQLVADHVVLRTWEKPYKHTLT